MHITVVGSGCVGVSTALHLSEALSHTNIKASIKLIDQSIKGAGQGCSLANACMLCVGSSIPRSLPSLFHTLSPSTATDSYINLRNCLPQQRKENRNVFLSFLKASSYSYPFTHKLTRKIALEVEALATAGVSQFDIMLQTLPELKSDRIHKNDVGQLVLFREKRGMNALVNRLQNNLSSTYMNSIQSLNWKECVQLEPCLDKYHTDEIFAGGVFKSEERIIEPTSFIQAMIQACYRLGVQIEYGTRVEQIIPINHGNDGWTVTSSSSNNNSNDTKDDRTDIIIICAGSHSSILLQRLGLSCPIYGLRGYSLTLDYSSKERQSLLPKHGIVFGDSNLYTTPLRNDNQLRITNFGDLDGLTIGQIHPLRLERILKQTQSSFPGIISENDISKCIEQSNQTRSVSSSSLDRNFFGWDDDNDKLKAWTGLRPFSPDYKPLIGSYHNNKTNNLFVNAGHGVMGWTTSNISAALITKQLFHKVLGQDLPMPSLAASAKAESLEETWFQPDRF